MKGRSIAIKRRNRPRFKNGRDPAYLDYIRSLPCCICGRIAEAAHVRSRGAGGTDYQTVPLCHGHHMEQHTIGIKTFQARYAIDLQAAAAFYVNHYGGTIGLST